MQLRWRKSGVQAVFDAQPPHSTPVGIFEVAHDVQKEAAREPTLVAVEKAAKEVPVAPLVRHHELPVHSALLVWVESRTALVVEDKVDCRQYFSRLRALGVRLQARPLRFGCGCRLGHVSPPCWAFLPTKTSTLSPTAKQVSSSPMSRLLPGCDRLRSSRAGATAGVESPCSFRLFPVAYTSAAAATPTCQAHRPPG